jgi:parallel beta-helix repeat protein
MPIKDYSEMGFSVFLDKQGSLLSGFQDIQTYSTVEFDRETGEIPETSKTGTLFDLKTEKMAPGDMAEALANLDPKLLAAGEINKPIAIDKDFKASEVRIIGGVVGGTGFVVTVDATGNGMFDTIQEAIDYVASKGRGKILIREGTYSITTGLTITNSNIELIGEGEGTIIQAGGNIDPITIGDGSTAYKKIRIHNLKIDGNAKTNAKGGIYFKRNITKSEVSRVTIDDISTNGILLERGCQENLITNNTISNCNYGILTSDVTGTVIQNNMISFNNLSSNATGIGLAGANYSHYNTVLGNLCDSNTSYGIHISGKYNSVTDNTCINSGGAGIYLAGQHNVISNNVCDDNQEGIYITATSGNNNLVSGNAIRSNDNEGIEVRASYCSIVGNIIYENGNEGIRLYDTNAAYNTISGNMLRDNFQGTYRADGGELCVGFTNYPASYNIITGNNVQITATKKANYGIRENDSNCDYNIILGNLVQGAVISNVSIQGPNTTVGHNI